MQSRRAEELSLPALGESAHALLAAAIEQAADRAGVWCYVRPLLDPAEGEEAARPEDEWLLIRAWLRKRRRWGQHLKKTEDIRDSTVELHIEQSALLTEAGVGRVCDLHGIHLPDALQQQGLGTALLQGLLAPLRELGVREVHACIATPAGDEATRSWGFQPAGRCSLGHERRVLRIRACPRPGRADEP